MTSYSREYDFEQFRVISEREKYVRRARGRLRVEFRSVRGGTCDGPVRHELLQQ